MKRLVFLASLTVLVQLAPVVADQKKPVDLELVLAVDVSDSITPEEKELQRYGYISAFRHTEVIQAIQRGFLGRIAVTYIEWAEPQSQHVVAPWTIIEDAQGAYTFAAMLSETLETKISTHMTSISGGLAFSALSIENNDFQGIRRAIDISGDGPNISGALVGPIRNDIVARGITINGLPLMLDPSIKSPTPRQTLEQYYRDCIIGGPGAFLIPVMSTDQLFEAIRRKLVLEIAGASPSLQYAKSGNMLAGEMLGDRYTSLSCENW